MATYDQLKEEITAKVVAALSEKLKNPKKADLDKDGKLSGYEKKRGAAIEKSMANQNESVDEINEEEEEELEERKKRDTPRDSDRREAEKLKINEEEEELDEISSDYGPGGDPNEPPPAVQQARAEEAEKERKAKKARTPGKTLEEDEEVVEETASNDEWYQNELFESLKKRWTK